MRTRLRGLTDAQLTQYIRQKYRDRLPMLRYRLRHTDDKKQREEITHEMRWIERVFPVRKTGGGS